MRSSQAHRRDPQLKLHKASGRGRAILNGQHHYTKAPFGTAECYEEYLDLLARWRANGREPLRPVQTPVELEQPQTVQQLSDAYERHLDAVQAYRKGGRETSQRGLVRIALKEFVSDFGVMPLRRLRAAEVVRHRDSLRAVAGLTVAGVNRKVGLIKQMIFWGVERGYVPEIGAASIITMRRLKTPRRARRPAADESHLDAALQHLAPTLATMVRLQRLTGMRPGEVCAMRWKDIDKDPGGEIGRRGLWSYRVDEAKSDSFHETRYLLNKAARALLSEFVKPPTAFIFSPRDTVRQRWPGGAPDLLAAAGDRYTTPSYRQALERACRAAKVPIISPHSIRHRFLTEVANDATLGLAAAAQAANHSNLATTTRYVHADPMLAVLVAEAVDRKASGQ